VSHAVNDGITLGALVLIIAAVLASASQRQADAVAAA
jgi:hypothetical protein